MNDLNDIQKLWSQQEPNKAPSSVSEIKAEAQKRLKASKKELWISIAVLGSLSAFLFLIILQLPDLKWPYGPGLLSMFLSVAIRASLEYISIFKQRKLNIALSPEVFRTKLIKYYKWRSSLLGIVTILSMSFYILGFCIMIPGFQAYMPKFMFFSVIGFILIMTPVFSIYLYKKAKAEKQSLEEMISELE